MKRLLLTTICTLASTLLTSTVGAQTGDLPQPTFGTIAVRLQTDGTLVGTVGHIDPSSLELIPMPRVTLSFIQNGRLVARSLSGPLGEIAVRGLSPQAVYSVIARASYEGQSWFLAHAVSVLSPLSGEPTAALSRSPAYRLTAARAVRSRLEHMAAPTIGLAMIPASDLGFDSDDTSAGVLGEGFVGPGGGGGGGAD